MYLPNTYACRNKHNRIGKILLGSHVTQRRRHVLFRLIFGNAYNGSNVSEQQLHT